MARRGKAGSELGLALLAVTLLFFGSSEADAAYRLTFQNGTSVEVRSYEDLGDSIRYPRLGGVVVVPKSSITAIEEAVHLPSPAELPAAPSTSPPPVPGAGSGDRSSYGVQALPPVIVSPVQIPTPQWQRAGNTAIDSRGIRILTGVGLFVALVGIVAFFVSNTWAGPDGRGENGANDRRAARRKGGRPLGVVLVSIYDAVSGVLLLGAGLTGAMIGQVIADLPVFLILPANSLGLIVVSLAAIVFGVVVLATVYGMWSLQIWGWRLQVVVCFTDISLNAYSLLVNPPSGGSVLAVAGLFVDSAILLYVGRPEIRERYVDDAWEIEDSREPSADQGPHTSSL